ncbi:MAG: UDP-N-acetylglucosamine 2-epimerase [Phycisphaerae bacterium]
MSKRTVAFVTGTRAESGLMRRTLVALGRHPKIDLKLVVTGMHTDAAVGAIEGTLIDGRTPDALIPWPQVAGGADVARAVATGRVSAELAGVYETLGVDIVLVVGDRVEAFAAAAAGHLSGRVVAHVHGGDRALGQMDDSLRHAITKLSHLHLAATQNSARRIIRMGERPEQVHVVGSPGIDGIVAEAAGPRRLRKLLGTLAGAYALLVHHPTRSDAAAEAALATRLLAVVREQVPGICLIDPNNDPGHEGIRTTWQAAERDPAGKVVRFANLTRADFLGLMRDARLLAGNSSSGIIEAGSFGTPVLNVGPRQAGRERGGNVISCGESTRAMTGGLRRLLAVSPEGRIPATNPYGGEGTAERIVKLLAGVPLTPAFRSKLIRY